MANRRRGRAPPLLLLLLLAVTVPLVAARSALYNTTSHRVPGKLNVHIVSHTHNDPGWISTYSQYHRTLVLDGHVIGGVEAILDTMTSALQDNPDRTFVYADLAFFVKWWQELHADSRALVRRLVAERRLEFTNGGLVQHDEACSHYGGMVEQMAAGMGFLWREFGVSPRIAWQLDGFGHSRSEPLLKAQGGFDALFFGRSDLVDMEARARARNLELMWRGSEGFGAESDLWVSQYPSGNYGPPSWSWFFERRNDYAKSLADAVKDDPEAQGDEFNVKKMVDLFVAKAKEWQGGVHGDDVLFLMGSDFTHSDARSWFANVDKLIHYVNRDGRVNAFYSTPSAYVATKRLMRPKLALKTDDFFPYGGNNQGTDYWTGFFTSRPNLKAQVQRGWALLRALHQLEALAELQPSGHNGLLATSRGLQYTAEQAGSETARFGLQLAPVHDAAALEFALATALHHDAVTGTSKLKVAQDYEAWLHAAVGKAAPKMLQGLAALLWPGHGIHRLAAPQPAALATDQADAASNATTAEDDEAADEAWEQQPAWPLQAGSGGMPVGGIFRRLQQHDARAPQPLPELHMCLLLNATMCSASAALSQEDGFLLVVWNPLGWAYEWGVMVPVADGAYAVTGPDGQPVAAQLLPLSGMDKALQEHTAGAAPPDAAITASAATQQLALLVTAPPLGHATYKVVRLPEGEAAGGSSSSKQGAAAASTTRVLEGGDELLELSTGLLTVTVSAEAGGIQAVAIAGNSSHGQASSGITRVNFTTALACYSGDRLAGSGAYTEKAERPADTLPDPEVTVLRGPVVHEVRQAYGELGALVTRLWHGSPRLEVRWTVSAPPPGADWEVSAQYASSLASAELWHTDANGREYQQRRRDYRPTFKLPKNVLGVATQKLPSNIYPVTTGAFLRGPSTPGAAASTSSDAATVMHVAVDRAQGVTSMVDGELELFLHRASARDDIKGMYEPLLDDHMAAGTHVISFVPAAGGVTGGGGAGVAVQGQHLPLRHVEQAMSDPFQLAFSALPSPGVGPYAPTSSGLVEPGALPAGVHLLTLKWLSCGQLLVRVSHMFQAGEHAELGGTVQLDVHRLLQMHVVRVEEATLFGERLLTRADNAQTPRQLHSANLTTWSPPLLPAPPREQPFSFKANRLVGPIQPGTRITLHPMQIRAFHITVHRADSECSDPVPEARRVARGSVAETVEWEGPLEGGASPRRQHSVLLVVVLLLATVSAVLGVALHVGGFFYTRLPTRAV